MRLNSRFKMLARNFSWFVLISLFFTSLQVNVIKVHGEEAVSTESAFVTSVKSGDAWYDNEGNSIQAHGGNIITYDNKYYWVGEDKSHNKAIFKGVNLYSSDDLMNWNYEGALITTETIGPDGEALGTCKVERPKLIYNEDTGKFVLWAHWENGSDYTKSKLLVATCDTINGSYEVQRIFNPGEGDESINDGAGYRSLDFTIYADSDKGEAWIISASGSNLMVYPLSDTYDDIDMTGAYMIFKGVGREAPALVRSGNYYYLFTSGQSGWYPNQCKYAYTEDISDPEGWSDLDYVGNNTTYYSQPTNIAVITQSDGTEGYIYMGDRWNSSALGASTYVWLPLEFYGTKAVLNYSDDWSFDITTGTFDVPEPTLVSEGKTAVASVETVSRPAGEAVDGITYNRNSSGDSSNYFKPENTVPFTWEVDLGKEYDLNRVDISFRIYNGSEVYYQYNLEGSNDNATWVELDDASDNTTVGFKSHNLTGIEETYRYIRINCSAVKRADNNSSAAWAAGITEVQVYADNLSNEEILQEWYSRYADKEQGYYTEESFVVLTEALTAADNLLENGEAEGSAYEEAAKVLKTAVKGLAYEDTLPVKVTGSIGTVAVYAGQSPELQDTVTVTTRAGETSEAEIAWYDLDEDVFSESYSTVTVYGQVKYTDLKVSGTVEVVPDNLLYFIDSGSLTYGSTAYTAVSALLGDSLLNSGPDQRYIAGTNEWGYTSTSTVYIKAQTAVVDKFTSGIYGNPLTYVVQLPQAGTYNIAVGATDWWGSNKVMTLTAVYWDENGEEQTVTLDTEYVRNLNEVTLETYQVTVDTATELKLTGTGNPAFSFIGINKISE